MMTKAWPMAVALAVATAVWMNSSSLQESQHADSLLLVLTSIQHWTPFYWGQDRYGMLIPLLAMPFRHPALNMVMEGILAATASLLAPFLVARFMTSDDAPWFAAGALTNLVFLLGMPRDVQFDWFVVQPYGLAIALGFCGLLLLDEPTAKARSLFGFVLMLLAHWVHAGIFIVLAPAILFGRRAAIRSLGATAIAAVSAASFARVLPLPRTPGGLSAVSEWTGGWVQLFRTGETVVAHPAVVGGFVVLGFVAAVFVIIKRDWRALGASAALLAVGATNWIAVGMSEWVRMNLYYPRYVFPSGMLFGVAFALLIARTAPLRAPMLAMSTSAALLVSTVAVFGVPSWQRLNDGLDARFGTLTPEVVRSHADVIGGDYWSVWPAVFHANLASYRSGHGKAIFGLTYRSEATDRLWRSNGTPTIVAAKPSDQAVARYADRAGIELVPLDHTPTLDLFLAGSKP
jgi:hypothetical protein